MRYALPVLAAPHLLPSTGFSLDFVQGHRLVFHCLLLLLLLLQWRVTRQRVRTCKPAAFLASRKILAAEIGWN
jgi:hypothetical protein